jgi:hypothetical protein
MATNIQTLKLTKIKEVVFSAVFTALAVYTPMILHYFGGAEAGKKFLPMPFFVLAAGLLLGWRAGLATGLFSPIVSFLLTGMPFLNILPIIIVQLSAFGFFAGILRKKYNIFFSLAAVVILGLVFTGLAVWVFSEMNAFSYVIGVARIGWIGIFAQFVFLPIFVKLLKKHKLSVY